ncbi:MAG: 30S ribosomal protein THX [Gammaproteobacteria bacterium]|nr:30S ribosomal protein THX [Gammaproteobacteria bacterium]MYE82821.1 30S ribosomal protein THX [Gammaproteobacteria bacterium]
MGKGDIRTRRGKINRGTYGVRRRRKARKAGTEGGGNRR